MRLKITLLLILLVSFDCYCQIIQLNEEERFVYKVKQLDELIERFNGSDKTLIFEYLNHNPEITLDRAYLIKTIFDSSSPNWKISDVKDFINQVSSKTNPIYLDFNDDLWFAEVKCSIVYNGKKENVTLILKIERQANNGSKWVLASAKGQSLNNINYGNITIFNPDKVNEVSISPISHATEFMILYDVFRDKKNLTNYISSNSKSSSLLYFIQEVLNGNITFKQVNSITYHFLQIDGWGFTVQKFTRPTKNSGWLVNSLTRMDTTAKQQYIASVLNIQR